MYIVWSRSEQAMEGERPGFPLSVSVSRKVLLEVAIRRSHAAVVGTFNKPLFGVVIEGCRIFIEIKPGIAFGALEFFRWSSQPYRVNRRTDAPHLGASSRTPARIP